MARALARSLGDHLNATSQRWQTFECQGPANAGDPLRRRPPLRPRAQIRTWNVDRLYSALRTVSALIIEHGGDEERAIGARLHDAAEDHGESELRRKWAIIRYYRWLRTIPGTLDGLMLSDVVGQTKRAAERPGGGMLAS